MIILEEHVRRAPPYFKTSPLMPYSPQKCVNLACIQCSTYECVCVCLRVCVRVCICVCVCVCTWQTVLLCHTLIPELLSLSLRGAAANLSQREQQQVGYVSVCEGEKKTLHWPPVSVCVYERDTGRAGGKLTTHICV